ncbi:MAG: hypothetical protein HFH91_09545 [Lachnospiraceae bacterium]|nr:hypothetical protein [Lachnospiraceae bacterium]
MKVWILRESIRRGVTGWEPPDIDGKENEMRITNRIMQRNNLSNINTNKIYQNKLSNQMSSQKKINRPSDDPVIAIRALRLRSNVTEITQYYSKNIPDAESWLKVTEDAISNLSQIITNMIARCNKGVNSYLKTEDRSIILKELKALGESVYATGDADYAGRYVFTGFRTDTSLSFLEAKEQKYTITEQLDSSAIDTVTKVDTDKLLDINANNFADAGMAVEEDDITSVEAYRIRLAYNNCVDAGDPADATLMPSIKFIDKDGNPQTWGPTDFELMHPYDKPTTGAPPTTTTYSSPYDYVAANKDALVYVPETGELLLGADRYDQLMGTKDRESTPNINEAEIQVTYTKSNWEKGDLRPEHYFYCKAEVKDAEGNTDIVEYNDSYIDPKLSAEHQIIEYDVGYNQTIRINSTADECFKHGIGREVYDIVNAMQDVLDLEGAQTDIDNIIKGLEADPASDPDGSKMEILQKQQAAVKKALELAKQKEQSLFAGGITELQKYLSDANLCVTDCGSRSSKLELIKNRSQNQKTTYETLKSENEDIDITEVAIELSAAELTYDAALMAAGKVMQNTLLNFI